MSGRLDVVSIVIVTYRGDGLLENCLNSLAAACGTEPQVVVVDNSPSESTRAIVARFPNARYVASPGNPGFAGGNNRGLPYCDRKYLLLLNNDTVVQRRESIERLAEFLDENPKCAVAQGTMIMPQNDDRLCPCGSVLTPFGFMHAKAAFRPRGEGPKSPYPCFSAIGAFMMVRRSAIAAAGRFLFRSHFWSYYEETDFCHRVWLSGNEVWFVPTEPIDHLCGTTSGMFPSDVIMGRYLRNQLFSLSSTLGFWSRKWLVPSQCCVVLAHGLLNLCMGKVAMFSADCGAIASLWRERARILAARRGVKRIRRVSDSSIFRKVMGLPPVGYMLRSLVASTRG